MNRLLATWLAVGALCGCSGAETVVTDPKQDDELESTADRLCAAGPTVEGIDVSVYQGNINWPAVRASGRVFAITRVSDGFFEDTKFAQNWSGMKSAGLIRGVYQFFRPGKDPIAQADLMLQKIGTLGPGDLAPMLDIEASDGQSPAAVAAAAHAWLTRVEQATGKKPFIYTYKSFWDVQVGGNTSFSGYPFIIAAYGPVCPLIPNAFSKWVMHQYSSTGSVPGIAGNVDLDRFNGTRAELEALANGGSASCSAQQSSSCGAYGCGCADGQCSGGWSCDGSGCSAQEKSNCGNFGCGCVDHKCSGGFCPGTGANAKLERDCGNFGCQAVDMKCSGGFCPGTGCTAKETLDCGNFGCNCVDHKCGGGFCPGTGCTAKETLDCGNFGCGCVDHACAGGFCPGTGCTAKETRDCGNYGCGCKSHQCSGGFCPTR